MVTAREYFEKDLSRVLRVHAVHSARSADGSEIVDVIAAVGLDFESAARFGALLVPPVLFVPAIVCHYLENIGDVLKVADKADVSSGLSGTSEHIPLRDLQFTGRLVVYTEAILSPEAHRELMELASQKGVRLVLRDGAYMKRRSELEVPMAFISHDSRDKDPFVRDLANTLQKMLCTVWYDEYSLVAGQSLRASIEKGLKECKKCVVIISPNFIGNEGWTKAEFDSIFTREILEKRNVIVPVWLGVSKVDVYEYSPRLLDKVGIPATLGVEEVCRRIVRALQHDSQ